MTIGELIKHLQTLDSELRVFKPGYEGGLDDITIGTKIVNVELDYYQEWYYGRHREAITSENNTNTIKGIVI